MSQFRVVVTDQVFPDVGMERQVLSAVDATVEVATGDVAKVLEFAQEADALLNTYLPLDGDAIRRLKRCRVIARYGIGVDNIDLEAAREVGIAVTNVPDYCVEEVAVHALALLLALMRRLPLADALVRAGQWGIGDLRPVHRISELTVGLIGYGRIARRLTSMLRELGASLVVHDPYVTRGPDDPEFVSLEELLRSSDAISVHAPLTTETRGLIGRRQLELMKQTAILVNTSRGPLVVLDDLLQALRTGQIAGAALDVFEEEPPEGAKLRDVPGLLVTPHMAFYSEAAIRESQHKAATQVLKVLTGEPPDYRVV